MFLWKLQCLHCRYIELTEEDKEKLKGSYKVAKKLEKLENRDKAGDSDEDDDYDCDPGCDYPSLDSFSSTLSDPPGGPASPESSLSPRPLVPGLVSPGGLGQSTPRSIHSPSVTTTGTGFVDIDAYDTLDRVLHT